VSIATGTGLSLTVSSLVAILGSRVAGKHIPFPDGEDDKTVSLFLAEVGKVLPGRKWWCLERALQHATGSGSWGPQKSGQHFSYLFTNRL
jgi:hypothetical protein